MIKKFTFSGILVTSILLNACSESDTADDTVMMTDSEEGVSTTSESENANGGWTHPVTAWGDPDLQGMWPIQHLIATPFQRPEQFGERLYFNEQELAEQASRLEARNTRYEEEDSQDRIGMGHWAETSSLPSQTSLLVDPPNGRFPELTEEGKAMSALMGSSWGQNAWDRPEDFDTWDRCITRGLPPSMFPFNYNNGIEVIQTPGYVVLNLEMIHEARIIPVDGRPPLDPEIRQWMGASRGHWEGNTLVIETTHFNGVPGMTNIGIPGSPPGNHATSTELRIVERLERISDDVINYSMTVEDPVTLTSSWTAGFPWQRDPDYQFFEYACHEDNYTIRDFITTSRYQRAQEAGLIE